MKRKSRKVLQKRRWASFGGIRKKTILPISVLDSLTLDPTWNTVHKSIANIEGTFLQSSHMTLSHVFGRFRKSPSRFIWNSKLGEREYRKVSRRSKGDDLRSRRSETWAAYSSKKEARHGGWWRGHWIHLWESIFVLGSGKKAKMKRTTVERWKSTSRSRAILKPTN